MFKALIDTFNDPALNTGTWMDAFRSMASWTPHDVVTNARISDLSGQNVILTGATGAIGREIARALAKLKPALLVLACRNVTEANKLADELKVSDLSTAADHSFFFVCFFFFLPVFFPLFFLFFSAAPRRVLVQRAS